MDNLDWKHEAMKMQLLAEAEEHPHEHQEYTWPIYLPKN